MIPRPQEDAAVAQLLAMVDQRDRIRACYDPVGSTALRDEENAATVEVTWGMLRGLAQRIRRTAAPEASCPTR